MEAYPKTKPEFRANPNDNRARIQILSCPIFIESDNGVKNNAKHASNTPPLIKNFTYFVIFLLQFGAIML